MLDTKGAAAQYYRDVADSLPYPRAQKARYLQELHSSLEGYESTHPNATADELHELFGDPVEIAGECLASDPIGLSRRVTKMNRLLHLLVALAIILIIITSVTAGITIKYYTEHRSLLDGFIVERVYESDYLVPVEDYEIVEVH